MSLSQDLHREIENGFEEFWNKYPANACFEYKGYKFSSERGLKSNKQVCYYKYIRLLNESKLSPKVLLKCMLVEVANRKEESYKHFRKDNKLAMMKHIEKWLDEECYIAYLGMNFPASEKLAKNDYDYENSTDM